MMSAKTLVRIMNYIVGLSFVLLMIRLIRSVTLATAFNFHFTWLSAIYAVDLIIALGFLTAVRIKGGRSRAIFWFMIYVSVVAAYLLASALKGASADHTTYVFWYHLLDFTGLLISPLFLVFVLAYIDRQDLLYRPLTWIAIFGSTFLLIPFTSSTFLGDPSKAVHYSYGFATTAPTGLGTIGATLWSTALLLVGMILLIQYYNQVKVIESLRKQARLFVIGTVVPTAVGYIGGAVLPLFNVVMPFDPFLTIFQLGLIGYALFRYKIFNVDPSALTDTVLETIQESVATVNSQQEIVYVNEAAERLLGISLKQIRGRLVTSISDKDTRHAILNLMKDGATSEPMELTIKSQGHPIPISLSVTKIISNNITEGYIFVFHDITKDLAIKRDIEQQVVERTRQLNNEHARLQGAMDSMSVGLLMTFRDTDAISYNAVLPKILSGTAKKRSHEASLTLDGLALKFHPTDFNLKKAIENCQLTAKPFEFKEISYEDQILRISGSPVSLHTGHVIGTVILFDNVTEAKIIERSKDEFFSIASHELRTPLTSIKGNTSMILQYYPEAVKDKVLHEMIDDIHDSSVRLIEVVNDFLDVSRLEQSKISFNYEEVHLEEILEGITYEMHAVLNEKKLYLKLDKITLGKLPVIWADKNRLKQVIYNLVGNASKFTEEGGITLNATENGDMIKVTVSDTGRGMTVASQQLLFRKFQQASSSILTRDATRGTGLGLYISKMIVEDMGGTISLEESIEGKGTTFSFTVPVATDQRKAAKAEPASTTDTGTGLSMPKK
jgi:PAS domain S-box-containing protein